ncbi:MAG: PIN domain-containing protein [Candidatus Firestonebacteria bacterium]
MEEQTKYGQAKYGIERTKYLIDTDVLINHINKKKDTLIKLSERENIILSLSVLNKFELYRGARTIKDKDIINDIVRFFDVIIVDDQIAEKAAELSQLGNLYSLGIMDLIIAATCILHNLILVTENKKHFKLIPEIEIYEKEKYEEAIK